MQSRAEKYTEGGVCTHVALNKVKLRSLSHVEANYGCYRLLNNVWDLWCLLELWNRAARFPQLQSDHLIHGIGVVKFD